MFGIRGSKHNGVLISRIAWLITVLGYWLRMEHCSRILFHRGLRLSYPWAVSLVFH